MKIRKGPDGIHLFDRNTGTNILLDEVIPLPSSWSASPRQVSIALTNACDLVCPHCYAPKKKASLDSRKVKRWIAELDENGCFGVGFGGGEPTLHPDLIDICKFGQAQTALAITVTTHGHRLDDILLKKVAENVNFVRVSMDGVGATYESIRNRSFDNLLKILRNMRDAVPFGINYVVNKKTINDLNEAIQISEDVGASEILLLPEVAVGRGEKIDDYSLSFLKSLVKNYNGQSQLSISSGYTDDFPVAIALDDEPDYLAFAHIDAMGNIKNTSFDKFGIKLDDLCVMSAFNKLIRKSTGKSI